MAWQISVPATTANMGPGFDCMGMALGLYNDFVMEPAAQDTVEAIPDAMTEAPSRHLVLQVAHKTCAMLGQPQPGLRLRQYSRIPMTRGLGSSAACGVAGVALAYAVCGKPLDVDTWIEIATQREGHPDNVTPAILGGITVCISQEETGQPNGQTTGQPTGRGGVAYLRIEPPRGLWMAAIVPDQPLPTRVARSVLPETLPFADGVFNSGRAALLAAALCAGRLDMLHTAMQDRLHQPYRAALVPGWTEWTAAIEQAGALAVTLSGAGPTMMAYGQGDMQPFLQALPQLPQGWCCLPLAPVLQGPQVREVSDI